MLQSEAGYIDARPHVRQIDETLLQRTAGAYMWVKSVGSTRPTSSRHVRCASDNSRIGALQRFDEECHKETYAVQQTEMLFDHLVGGDEQRWWDCQAERVCRLEVGDKFNFCGLLHRQLGRLFTLENAAGVDADQAKHFR